MRRHQLNTFTTDVLRARRHPLPRPKAARLGLAIDPSQAEHGFVRLQTRLHRNHETHRDLKTLPLTQGLRSHLEHRSFGSD